MSVLILKYKNKMERHTRDGGRSKSTTLIQLDSWVNLVYISYATKCILVSTDDAIFYVMYPLSFEISFGEVEKMVKSKH